MGPDEDVQTRLRPISDLARELADALKVVEELGVRTRATRFHSYVRVLSALAESRATPEDTALQAEATNQAAQLVSAIELAATVDLVVLAAKLERVMSGADLAPENGAEDTPRNILFELMVAYLLGTYG